MAPSSGGKEEEEIEAQKPFVSSPADNGLTTLVTAFSCLRCCAQAISCARTVHGTVGA